MSHSDPIADALTRVRNAVLSSQESVYVPSNNTIRSVMNILKEEGFIEYFGDVKNSNYPLLRVALKYYEGRPVLRGLKRISKPGRRIYVNRKRIGSTLNHIGVGIITTSKGILSDKEAKYQRVGGEYICQVW